MIINWYGEGCFRLQSGEVNVLVDPIEAKIGLIAPRFHSTCIVRTINNTETNENPSIIERSENIVIKSGGEYDIQGVEIRGFNITEESTEKFSKTVYVLNIEGIKIGLLGHLSGALSVDVANAFGGVNVLVIPAGGKPFIEINEAVKLIKKIEPKIVIPSFFKIIGLKREASDVNSFVKILGIDSAEEEKLVIKKKDFIDSKMRVAVLKV